MDTDLVIDRIGPALRVTFARPEAHNALTFAMYEGLAEACAQADADESVRAVVVRGAGGRAFVSGTDIAQFAGMDGPGGVEYEERVTRVVHPGSTDTDMNPAAGPGAPAQRARSALGHFQTAEDVAATVAHLAGPGGRTITGAALLVDAGANA